MAAAAAAVATALPGWETAAVVLAALTRPSTVAAFRMKLFEQVSQTRKPLWQLRLGPKQQEAESTTDNCEPQLRRLQTSKSQTTEHMPVQGASLSGLVSGYCPVTQCQVGATA